MSVEPLTKLSIAGVLERFVMGLNSTFSSSELVLEGSDGLPSLVDDFDLASTFSLAENRRPPSKPIGRMQKCSMPGVAHVVSSSRCRRVQT